MVTGGRNIQVKACVSRVGTEGRIILLFRCGHYLVMIRRRARLAQSRKSDRQAPAVSRTW
jgi:hypothetical protein